MVVLISFVSIFELIFYSAIAFLYREKEILNEPGVLYGLSFVMTQGLVFFAAEAKRQLLAAGFHLLNENDEWDLKPGGRYFFTRNMSCLVAFAVGEK